MRAAALAAALLLALPLLPAHAQPAASVADYWVTVDGESAHGLVATPAGTPLGLVVILHGYTHQAESHRGHLLHLAEQGYVAVAMDYRGDVDAFPLAAGAADTIAATQDLMAAYGFTHATLYSVSMGTAVAGIVLAELPVFRHWVNNEGLSMLHETWAGATALSPSGNAFAIRAAEAIEQETGGTPATHLDAYLARSAAVRAAEFSGLEGVVLTHGLNDGLVPYNHGREMQAALHAIDVPTHFYTVLRCPEGNEGTTITGYIPNGPGGAGLAGHGSEGNDDHCLTALSFQLLDRVLAGDVDFTGRGEHFRDGGAAAAP